MSNWSGKKKAKSKAKRKAKTAKREERKTQGERTSVANGLRDVDRSSSSAVESSDSVPIAATQGGLAAINANWKARWNGIPTQYRVAGVLGIAAVAALAVYQYLNTRPVAPQPIPAEVAAGTAGTAGSAAAAATAGTAATAGIASASPFNVVPVKTATALTPPIASSPARRGPATAPLADSAKPAVRPTMPPASDKPPRTDSPPLPPPPKKKPPAPRPPAPTTAAPPTHTAPQPPASPDQPY